MGGQADSGESSGSLATFFAQRSKHQEVSATGYESPEIGASRMKQDDQIASVCSSQKLVDEGHQRASDCRRILGLASSADRHQHSFAVRFAEQCWQELEGLRCHIGR